MRTAFYDSLSNYEAACCILENQARNAFLNASDLDESNGVPMSARTLGVRKALGVADQAMRDAHRRMKEALAACQASEDRLGPIEMAQLGFSPPRISN